MKRSWQICSVGILLAVVFSKVVAADMLPGFAAFPEFHEQHRWDNLSDGVRVCIIAPQFFRKLPRQLVIYATPNGSTIEQTLGCEPLAASGKDWKYAIQHVLAQVRCYREYQNEADVILAVVQAPKLSWPAFRAEFSSAGNRIRALVEQLQGELNASDLILSCHSGGGSFLWGWINSHNELPNALQRMIFLDANYSYSDDERHGDKLIQWLRNPRRQLVVVAYDDREVTLNGRKVVGPDGGTYRATERMKHRFNAEASGSLQTNGNLDHSAWFGGQAQFLVHRNPENRILHTVLVGDLNGLVYGLTLRTPWEKTWGTFGESGACKEWIPQQAVKDPSRNSASLDPTQAVQHLPLPARPANAIGAADLVQELGHQDREVRERRIEQEILAGNLPSWSRQLVPIRIQWPETGLAERSAGATIFVMSDYLAIGSDDHAVRMPLTPRVAARIAQAVDGMLITPRICDHVYSASGIRLEPRPLSKDRETLATFLEHSQLIDVQLRQRVPDFNPSTPLLICGSKKDVVITPQLLTRPDRVAIYGWHYPNGAAIQPLNLSHVHWYTDYSHGIRLMSSRMVLNGASVSVRDVLMDPDRCGLISAEGPFSYDAVLASILQTEAVRSQ